MKKKLIITIIVIFMVASGVRFYFVNRNVDAYVSAVQVFPKGEEVPIGTDYFETSDEHMEGYSFKILDAEIVPVEDFLKRYNAEGRIEDIGRFTEYIYAVRVIVGNKDNPYGEEAGISLRQVCLTGTDYILNLEEVCFETANPDMPGVSFALRKNTSLEMLLTFDVIPLQTSKEHMISDVPKLQISQYPHKKLLELY